MDAIINYSASVTVDGEVRQIAGSETIEVNSMVTGSQTVGATYEALAATTVGNSALLLYNAGAVDVSIRVRLANFSINEYLMFTLISGGVMHIPHGFVSDEGRLSVREDVFARTASGTATIDYCHLQ